MTQNAQGEMNSTDLHTTVMCIVGIQNTYFKIGNQITLCPTPPKGIMDAKILKMSLLILKCK